VSIMVVVTLGLSGSIVDSFLRILFAGMLYGRNI